MAAARWPTPILVRPARPLAQVDKFRAHDYGLIPVERYFELKGKRQLDYISSQGCNIEVVLIDTEAHKAIDVFYITAEGRKPEPAQLDKLGDALRRACEG